MKKMILAFVISVMAMGCGVSLNTEYISPATNSKYGYIKSYTISRKITAYIGEPLIQWKESIVDTIPEIIFQGDFSLTGTYRNGPSTEYVAIKGIKGDTCKLIGVADIEGRKYYVINAKNNDEREKEKNKTYGLLIDVNGLLNKNVIADAKDDYKGGFVAKESVLIPPDAHFLYVKEKSVVRPRGISRELIFGGVNNVSINVTFREYTSDDLARQAFFQNIIYQTSADIIRFKSFKIKVHEVTNEKIVFTVLEDGLDLPTP